MGQIPHGSYPIHRRPPPQARQNCPSRHVGRSEAPAPLRVAASEGHRGRPHRSIWRAALGKDVRSLIQNASTEPWLWRVTPLAYSVCTAPHSSGISGCAQVTGLLSRSIGSAAYRLGSQPICRTIAPWSWISHSLLIWLLIARQSAMIRYTNGLPVALLNIPPIRCVAVASKRRNDPAAPGDLAAPVHSGYRQVPVRRYGPWPPSSC